MRLSIIIPCLNAEATLPVQLEALSGQEWNRPWEVIVVDNGSRDDSVRVATAYRKCLSNLTVVKAPEKKSASYARNVGARKAASDRLAFCDADDEVGPGWVASIGEALDKYCVVHGRFRFDKFNDPHQAEKAAAGWKDGLTQKHFLPGGGTGNLGIHRWVHEKIGGFAECIPRFEDSDYYWKIQLEGFTLHYVPEAVVQVRIGRIKPTLTDWFRRYRTGAAGKYWLYRRFKHLGMRPDPQLENAFVAWLKVARRGLDGGLGAEHRRREWLKKFAQHSGTLAGEIQGRVMNPCEAYHPQNKTEMKNGHNCP